MRKHLVLLALVLSICALAAGPVAEACGPSLLGVSSGPATSGPAAPVSLPAPAAHAGQLRVSFIDGNTGMVLETPAGRTYVIDPGGEKSFEERMGPFLRSRGIKRIDGVVITHPHTDHYDGLRYRSFFFWTKGLLAEFDVGELLDAAELSNGDTHDYLALIAPAVRVPRTSGLRAGQVLSWDPALEVEVMSPPAQLFSRAECVARAGYDTEANWTNESSVVLKVSHGDVSFLFTGDIHDLGMAYLIDKADAVTVDGKSFPARRNPNPIRTGDIDVLALPHHGFGRDSYAPFRDTVRPAVSIAPNDRRVFKEARSKERLKWWDTATTDLFWTAPEYDGLTTVVSDGARFSVTSARGRTAVYAGTPGSPQHAAAR